MTASCMIAKTVSRPANQTGGVKGICQLSSKNVLTLSDVVPSPLIILEERMPLDLVYTITTKSNFPIGVKRKY